MPNDIIWKEVESQQKYNPTNLAAAGQEQIFAGTTRVEYYNRLLVQNNDAVRIAVLLDGTTSGRLFEVASNGGILMIEPGDGIHFNQIHQINKDGAVAEVAGTILFRAAKAVPFLTANGAV